MRASAALAALLAATAASASEVRWGTAVESTYFSLAQTRGASIPRFQATQDSVFFRPAPKDEPDEVVDLAAVFNKNWEADSFPTPDGPAELGTHFDFKGDAYLSVRLPHAQVATLYKYESGMGAVWTVGGERYEMSLDISIFRARVNNYVVVKRLSDDKVVYKRRIREILLRTWPLGRSVVVSGREYRVYFSYGVGAGSPSRADLNNHFVAFVTNVGTESDRDYRSYIIPFSTIEGANPVAFRLYEGAVVRLRGRRSPAELDVFLP